MTITHNWNIAIFPERQKIFLLLLLLGSIFLTFIVHSTIHAQPQSKVDVSYCLPLTVPCVFEPREGDGLIHFADEGTRVFDPVTDETLASSEIPFDSSIPLPLAYTNGLAKVSWSSEGKRMVLMTEDGIAFYHRDEAEPYATFPHPVETDYRFAVWNPRSDVVMFFYGSARGGIWLSTLNAAGEPETPIKIELEDELEVRKAVWSPDGEFVIAIVSLERAQYQLVRLDPATGEVLAMLLDAVSALAPTLKWLDDGRLRVCCMVDAIGDGPDGGLGNVESFDIDSETWEVRPAPSVYVDMPQLHDNGHYAVQWLEGASGIYTLSVVDLNDNRVIAQYDQEFPYERYAPPLRTVWVGDTIIESDYIADQLYPDNRDALFIWKPLIAIK